MVPPPLLKDTVELRRIGSLVFITHSPCRNEHDWFQRRTCRETYRTTLRTKLIDNTARYHSRTVARDNLLFCFRQLTLRSNETSSFVTLQLFGTISWEEKGKNRRIKLWVSRCRVGVVKIRDTLRHDGRSVAFDVSTRKGEQSQTRCEVVARQPATGCCSKPRKLEPVGLARRKLPTTQPPKPSHVKLPMPLNFFAMSPRKMLLRAPYTRSSNLHCHSVAFTMSFCRVDRVVYSLSSFYRHWRQIDIRNIIYNIDSLYILYLDTQSRIIY